MAHSSRSPPARRHDAALTREVVGHDQARRVDVLGQRCDRSRVGFLAVELPDIPSDPAGDPDRVASRMRGHMEKSDASLASSDALVNEQVLTGTMERFIEFSRDSNRAGR